MATRLFTSTKYGEHSIRFLELHQTFFPRTPRTRLVLGIGRCRQLNEGWIPTLFLNSYSTFLPKRNEDNLPGQVHLLDCLLYFFFLVPYGGKKIGIWGFGRGIVILICMSKPSIIHDRSVCLRYGKECWLAAPMKIQEQNKWGESAKKRGKDRKSS